MHELVGRLGVELAGHVDLHDVADEVDGGTDVAEHIDHREDVGDTGDVCEHRPALGEQRGRHELQGGVLRAGNHDRARELVTTFNIQGPHGAAILLLCRPRSADLA